MTWVLVITLLEITLTLTSLYLLIKDGSKPERIWSWILIILFIPFLGAMLYFFFGVNLENKNFLI